MNAARGDGCLPSPPPPCLLFISLPPRCLISVARLTVARGGKKASHSLHYAEQRITKTRPWSTCMDFSSDTRQSGADDWTNRSPEVCHCWETGGEYRASVLWVRLKLWVVMKILMFLMSMSPLLIVVDRWQMSDGWCRWVLTDPESGFRDDATALSSGTDVNRGKRKEECQLMSSCNLLCPKCDQRQFSPFSLWPEIDSAVWRIWQLISFLESNLIELSFLLVPLIYVLYERLGEIGLKYRLLWSW